MIIFSAIIEDPEEESKLLLLYSTYKSSMYYVAFNILKNEHDAEDAVQLSLLKLIPILSEINKNSIDSSSTKNLLITITKHTAIDLYRKNIKLAVPYEFAEENGSVSSAEELYLEADDYKTLLMIIDELDDKYREVLRLRYLYQLTDRQIADLLNISYGNVRIRLERARKLLAERLREKKNER